MNTQKCSKCLEELPISNFYYHARRHTRMKSCKKCNSKECRTYQANKRSDIDVNFLLRSRAANIKRNCKSRTILRDVAPNLPDVLLAQYSKQEGKCYYTGEPMTLVGYATDKSFATVDRLDSTKGYVEGNVVFCKSIINRMKQDMTLPELKLACEQLLVHINSVGDVGL